MHEPASVTNKGWHEGKKKTQQKQKNKRLDFKAQPEMWMWGQACYVYM